MLDDGMAAGVDDVGAGSGGAAELGDGDEEEEEEDPPAHMSASSVE